ncbi:MAG: sensor histidine kinase [Oscillibacter sp.]|nr:sensor histidine kinase [Oscillibacter sp.]
MLSAFLKNLVALQQPRSIRISGKRQGDFYMLIFENTCAEGPLPPQGTGISNIKSVAERYRGAVLTEKTGGRFSLSVLLNIS